MYIKQFFVLFITIFLMIFISFCTSINSKFISDKFPEAVIQNHADIFIPNESFGSATYIGNGLFLTAYHIIINKESKAILMYKKVKYIIPDPIWVQHDIALFYIPELNDNNYRALFTEMPKVGDMVFWSQPLFTNQDSVIIHSMHGMISFVDENIFYIDLPIYQSASGAGVYNSNGYLVGIITQFYIAYNQKSMYVDNYYKLMGKGVNVEGISFIKQKLLDSDNDQPGHFPLFNTDKEKEYTPFEEK